MVQIVQNWSDVDGKVQAMHPSQTNIGFMAADLLIEKTALVDGFPDLLLQRVGTVITLQIPQEVADRLALKTHDKLHARVRQGGPNRFFIDPERVQKK